MPTVAALKEYDARTDAKKRVTIRGDVPEYFRVVHRNDGSILLKPRVLQDAPDSGAARKARALKIAANGGSKTAAIVKRMVFRKANAREKAIAATLTQRASAALKRHGRAKT